MRLPMLRGLIRRRLLVNFRVDAEVMSRLLPQVFRPKLQGSHAIAGICLIRLEQIRPAWLPSVCGISSENAAHRVAVLWDGPDGFQREGVYIPRRDTSSWLNHWAGGRLFPGEHHRAHFFVTDGEGRISLSVRAQDEGMLLELRARAADSLPATSCFSSLEEASAFFEAGSIGYSVTRDDFRLDGVRLKTDHWEVQPLEVDLVESSFFADESVFPAGSVVFDHALIMRDCLHHWHQEEDMTFESCCGTAGGHTGLGGGKVAGLGLSGFKF